MYDHRHEGEAGATRRCSRIAGGCLPRHGCLPTERPRGRAGLVDRRHTCRSRVRSLDCHECIRSRELLSCCCPRRVSRARPSLPAKSECAKPGAPRAGRPGAGDNGSRLPEPSAEVGYERRRVLPGLWAVASACASHWHTERLPRRAGERFRLAFCSNYDVGMCDEHRGRVAGPSYARRKPILPWTASPFVRHATRSTGQLMLSCRGGGPVVRSRHGDDRADECAARRIASGQRG